MFFCPELYSWKVDPVQIKVTQGNTFATLRVIYSISKGRSGQASVRWFRGFGITKNEKVSSVQNAVSLKLFHESTFN